MKHILLVTFSIGLIFSLNAQKALPYYTGFDNALEQNGWAQYRLGAMDPFDLWEYSAFSGLSAPNSLIHNYPVGGTQVTDDWFVSPAIDFSSGGNIDSLWYYFSGFGTPQTGDTIALYLLENYKHPDSSSSKTILILFTDTSYINDNTWKYKSNIAIPANSNNMYLAFRYKTTNNWLDVKIDNIYISGSTSINENFELNKQVIIHPNPVKNKLNLTFNTKLTIEKIELLNTSGKLINTYFNKTTIDVSSLPNAVYFLKIKAKEGIVTKKFVKSN